MCYSKEVTFLVGTVMVSGSAYTWWKYVRNNTQEALNPVFRNIIQGYLCVALHQFGESISIATENQLIYKFGLIASITCMYFYMRSLEKLSNLSFGSTMYGVLIGLCAVHILLSDFTFENATFWVRGDRSLSYLIWSGMWLALFIYWNVCILYFRKLNRTQINKQLLIEYGLYTINISFILYLIYAYISLFMREAPTYTWDVFESFDMVKDSPSIWCIFSVVQTFLIPVLFKHMRDRYNMDESHHTRALSAKTKLKIAGISAGIWLLILGLLPMAFGAASKMVAG